MRVERPHQLHTTGERLVCLALCAVLYFAAGANAVAAPDQGATQAAHACPNSDANTPHRPVGFDGRRIRPID